MTGPISIKWPKYETKIVACFLELFDPVKNIPDDRPYRFNRGYIFTQNPNGNKWVTPFIFCSLPPYTSKYNPIKHRLFLHITRACQGVIFKTVELVNEYMAKAKTTTGLEVFTRILKRTFETGRKVAENFLRKTCEFNLTNISPNGTMLLSQRNPQCRKLLNPESLVTLDRVLIST